MDRRRSAVRRERQGRWRAGLGFLIAAAMAGAARGQDEIRNFRTPILAVESGGHHARIRSLIWQDDVTLISGGEDKVVRVWDLRDARPRLSQSIRPMIWRGPAGAIYAMALSPRPDARGQRYLAVGGFGVSAQRGDLTVYRLPGLERIPTGDVAARRTSPAPDQPMEIGHRQPITGLAFDPTGRVLASSSNDGTIILWDAPAFRPRAVLTPPPRAQGQPPAPIRAMGFSPDGTRLATGGADGALRIWDVDRAVQVVALGGNANRPNAINTVAYTRDGMTIIVGQELPGVMLMVQVANPAVGIVPWRPAPHQGQFEFLTVHPDAARPRVAVSIKSDGSRVPDPMRIACDIEIRDLVGRTAQRLREQVPGLVFAMAFSPDGRRLAYAGGEDRDARVEDQGIRILDLAAPDRPPVVIRGEGTTTLDVRFSADSSTVGFTRQAFDPAAPPANYEAFRLDRREPATVARADLPAGAIAESQGWTIRRGAQPWQFVAARTGRPDTTIDIDRTTERQIWSWTIVPADPARHPRPTLAVGTESGIAVFDLETGRRTRTYAGHDSPVVALAPSPDGRWLASGSIDQTILLYPLDGCDVRAPFGAELRPRPDGTSMVVATVKPRTYATAMGLLPGDEVTMVGIGHMSGRKELYRAPAEIAGFLARMPETLPALDTIGFEFRRTLPILGVGPVRITLRRPTTQRDNPALALFLGRDREWVFWTPRGYYETSIEGDARFLGWHINPPFGTERPTDFVAIGAFAEAMNRRDVLDRVWQAGVLDRVPAAPAVAAVPAAPPAPERSPAVVAAEDQPPRIIFAPVAGGVQLPAPGVTWVVNRPTVRVSMRLEARGKLAIGRRRIILDERPMPGDPTVGPVDRLDEVIPLANLAPNRPIRLAVEASNVAGNQRTESIDVLYVPPARPVAPAAPAPEALPAPKLHLLAIGCGQFAGGLPPVEFAGQDAEALAAWLAEHLTAADGSAPAPADVKGLVGSAASAGSIAAACGHLHELAREKKVGPRDVVAVVIASHLLSTSDGVAIAGADTVANGAPPRPVVPSADLAAALGQLTDYGCRVVVFLDGVHTLDAPLRDEVKPFVRDLQRKRGVIAFIASKEVPSGVEKVREHGYFALGIMQVFAGAETSAAGKDRRPALTLDQFRILMQTEVLNLSARRQLADGYFPSRMPPKAPFVRPR